MPKRDVRFLHSATKTRTTTVFVKNQGCFVLLPDESGEGESFSPDGHSEFIDLLCDTFHALQDHVASHGLPLLQTCRFPDFIDFVQTLKNTS